MQLTETTEKDRAIAAPTGSDCLVNYMTNEADIYAVFEEILRAGESLLSLY
ncbi:MAG TPA: hypothetical protein VKV40_09220 [Ktedonobacteraceae bacterium]|nr:hypothetical protein [Ktedonobacteraceae bacterium]